MQLGLVENCLTAQAVAWGGLQRGPNNFQKEALNCSICESIKPSTWSRIDPTTGQKQGWRGREAAEGKSGRYSRETDQVKRLRIIRTRFLTTRKCSYKNGKEENKNEPCYIVVLDWNWKCQCELMVSNTQITYWRYKYITKRERDTWKQVWVSVCGGGGLGSGGGVLRYSLFCPLRGPGAITPRSNEHIN